MATARVADELEIIGSHLRGYNSGSSVSNVGLFLVFPQEFLCRKIICKTKAKKKNKKTIKIHSLVKR